MSTNKEIKYDAADNVKLNDEVMLIQDASIMTAQDLHLLVFVGRRLLKVVQSGEPTKNLYKICEKITPWVLMISHKACVRLLAL